MLDGDELMLLLPSLDKSHMEGDFEFLRNHDRSTFIAAHTPIWSGYRVAAL